MDAERVNKRLESLENDVENLKESIENFQKNFSIEKGRITALSNKYSHLKLKK